MGLLSELRRRNVFRVAIAYVIIAWIILQVADVLGPALLLDEWVNRALAFFLILGFPAALVFAWAFELTPEGIKLDRHVDRSKSITHITGRKLDYLIIAVLALALAVFAFNEWVLEPSHDTRAVKATTEAVTGQATESADEDIGRNTVAVLPFADLSPAGDHEFFADGLTEELIMRLARLEGLQVTGRASSFYFKNQNEDPQAIGQKLGVGYLLDGSVRQVGDELRVTAKLTSVESGMLEWSDTYPAELGDLFVVQEQIAEAVATALGVGLKVGDLAEIEGSTDNILAYQEYLAGKAAYLGEKPHSLQSVEHFERATELDPGFALAWARLAEACHIASLDERTIGTTGFAERADDAIKRALSLAPQSREVLLVQAQLRIWKNQFGEARLVLDSLHRRSKDPDVRYTDVDLDLALKTGRINDAFRAIKSMMRHDPFNPHLPTLVAHAYFIRGRLEDALAERERAYQSGNRTVYMANVTVPIALATGRRDEIEKWLRRAHEDVSFLHLGQTTNWEVLADNLDDRDAMLESWRDLQSNPASDWAVTVWAAWLGDDEMALRSMQRTPDVWFMWTPLLERLRKTDEFKRVVIDIGLVDYWREYGWGEFCKPTEGNDFDCR